MSESVTDQVVEICREVLEDPRLTLESTSASVEKWDSLGHMNLITALEARFTIELDVMEMAEVDCVQALVEVVQNALRAPRDQVRSCS